MNKLTIKLLCLFVLTTAGLYASEKEEHPVIQLDDTVAVEVEVTQERTLYTWWVNKEEKYQSHIVVCHERLHSLPWPFNKCCKTQFITGGGIGRAVSMALTKRDINLYNNALEKTNEQYKEQYGTSIARAHTTLDEKSNIIFREFFKARDLLNSKKDQ